MLKYICLQSNMPPVQSSSSRHAGGAPGPETRLRTQGMAPCRENQRQTVQTAGRYRWPRALLSPTPASPLKTRDGIYVDNQERLLP